MWNNRSVSRKCRDDIIHAGRERRIGWGLRVVRASRDASDVCITGAANARNRVTAEEKRDRFVIQRRVVGRFRQLRRERDLGRGVRRHDGVGANGESQVRERIAGDIDSRRGRTGRGQVLVSCAAAHDLARVNTPNIGAAGAAGRWS